MTLGDERTDLVRIEVPAPIREGATIRSQVIYVDGFGNLTTNIAAEDVPGAIAAIEVEGRSFAGPPAVPTTYTASGMPGTVVAVVNSWGLIEIAVRCGNARADLHADVGSSVSIVLAVP